MYDLQVMKKENWDVVKTNPKYFDKFPQLMTVEVNYINILRYFFLRILKYFKYFKNNTFFEGIKGYEIWFFFQCFPRSLRPQIKPWNLSFALVIDAIEALIKGFISSSTNSFFQIYLETRPIFQSHFLTLFKQQERLPYPEGQNLPHFQGKV